MLLLTITLGVSRNATAHWVVM